MASAVDICNLALQRLGAKSIGALTEDTTAGRECNRVYEHARDSELRSHQWSFARTRVEVAADSVAPTFVLQPSTHYLLIMCGYYLRVTQLLILML